MSPKFKLILIIVVMSSPLFASYATYYFWKPTHFTNYGELLPTKPLSLANSQSMAGGGLDSLKDKWVLLTVDSGECAAACQEKLYLIRQVRTAEGKYMDRIARALIVDDGASIDMKALKEYEGTVVLKGSAETLNQLRTAVDARNHVFLIDPLGNLVLRYPANPDPKRMIKDLTRLLTVSKIG